MAALREALAVNTLTADLPECRGRRRGCERQRMCDKGAGCLAARKHTVSHAFGWICISADCRYLRAFHRRRPHSSYATETSISAFSSALSRAVEPARQPGRRSERCNLFRRLVNFKRIKRSCTSPLFPHATLTASNLTSPYDFTLGRNGDRNAWLEPFSPRPTIACIFLTKVSPDMDS